MRSAFRAALCVVACAALSTSAHADKAHPVPGRATGPFHWISLDGMQPLAPICQMGEPDTSLNEINYIEPPNDSYYTFLRASDCGTCVAPDSVLIKFAHVVLNFPVQCILQTRVTIVAAKPIGGGCFEPDTTVVLCPPRDLNLEPTSSGIFDIAAALTPGCKVARDAFVCFTFMGFGPECAERADRPRLMLSSQCPTCESYNHFGDPRQSVDLCPQLLGRPTMYVDGEECVITPTLVRSWGSLKIRYR